MHKGLIDQGINVELRGACYADFTYSVHHESKTVYVEYSGSDLIMGGDKTINWSVGTDPNSHKDQTSFSYTYKSNGSKQICVTFNEYSIVTDTVYVYRKTKKDTIVDDTTYLIDKVKRYPLINQKKSLICSGTKCKTFEIGGCTPSFDFNEGHDGIVNFINKSTTVGGAPITGYGGSEMERNLENRTRPIHTLVMENILCP